MFICLALLTFAIVFLRNKSESTCANIYDPGTGRFLSEDPITLMSGTSNYYVYAKNNPLRYFDPLGLTQEDIDIAFMFAHFKYPEATNVSVRVALEGEMADSRSGEYNPFTNEIVVNRKYLNKLCAKKAAELLDTAFHEVYHSQNRYKMLLDLVTPGSDKKNPFHKDVYNQATMDTADAIVDFLNERKKGR